MGTGAVREQEQCGKGKGEVREQCGRGAGAGTGAVRERSGRGVGAVRERSGAVRERCGSGAVRCGAGLRAVGGCKAAGGHRGASFHLERSSGGSCFQSKRLVSANESLASLLPSRCICCQLRFYPFKGISASLLILGASSLSAFAELRLIHLSAFYPFTRVSHYLNNSNGRFLGQDTPKCCAKCSSQPARPLFPRCCSIFRYKRVLQQFLA